MRCASCSNDLSNPTDSSACGRNAATLRLASLWLSQKPCTIAPIELGAQGILFAGIVAHALQMKAQAGEVLRQGIVHLVGQPLPFFHDRLQPPSGNETITSLRGQQQKEKSERENHKMTGAPPGRCLDHLYLFHRRE